LPRWQLRPSRAALAASQRPPFALEAAASILESAEFVANGYVAFLNAGVGDFHPLEKWDEASFDRSVAINLKGPFFLLQALLPILANPASNRQSTRTSGCPPRASLRSPKRGCARPPARSRANSSGAAFGSTDQSRTDRDASPRQDRDGRKGDSGFGQADPRRPLRTHVGDRRGGALLGIRRVGLHHWRRARHRWRHEHAVSL